MDRRLGASFALFSLAVLAAAASAQETCTGDQGTLYYGTTNPRAKTGDVSAPGCGNGRGMVLGGHTDADGTPRYACLNVPEEPSCPSLPLLVYIHPSLFDPDTLYVTNIPEAVDTANLSNDPGCPGFILLAPQGRDTEHFYPYPDRTGLGWDNWYRPADPSRNVDVETIDHFIDTLDDTLAAKGVHDRFGNALRADPKRIFLSGWSNGSAMAIYYGHVRPSKIAAVGVYSAPNPYGEFDDPCPVLPDFAAADATISGVPPVPLMHMHNDCDIAGICPSGENLAAVLVRSGEPFQDALFTSALQPADQCVSQDVIVEKGCDRNRSYQPGDGMDAAGLGLDTTVGSINHVRWPQTWTPALFNFYRLHPHP
jgi:poly(3-hydroxybutyrate) depolymerase